jgi:hypothetical protein
MGKLVLWLQGKKVYILAILGVLAGLVQFLSTGDFSIGAIIALGKTTWMMALIAAIRAGISKSKAVTK